MSSEAAAYGTSGGRKTGEPGVDLRVSRSLDVLVQLKKTVSEFAKKEEDLTRELLARRGAANRKHRDGIERSDAKLAAQLGETEARFKAEEDRVNTIHSARRARIDMLGVVGIRGLPKRPSRRKADGWAISRCGVSRPSAVAARA